MSANRFMVIKVRELLKTIIFSLLGVIIIIAIIYFAVNTFTNLTALYSPGIYTTEIQLDNGEATVAVEVNKRKITAINVIEKSDALPVFYPLLETVGNELEEKVVSAQSTEVEITQGSEFTSAIILNAIDESIEKAKIQ